LNAALDLELAAVVPSPRLPNGLKVESFENIALIASITDTALALSTGAEYNDSSRNDYTFFQFPSVSEQKSEKVSTSNQYFLKAV